MYRLAQPVLLITLAGVLLRQASAQTCYPDVPFVLVNVNSDCTDAAGQVQLLDVRTGSYCEIAAGGRQCADFSPDTENVSHRFFISTNPTCSCVDATSTQYIGSVKTASGDILQIGGTNLQCILCVGTLPDGSSIAGDPVVTAFDGSKFFFHAEHGRPVAMLSAPDHAINAEIGTLQGTAGDFNDEWLQAVAVRYQDTTVEVRINVGDEILEVYHDADATHASQKRMRVKNGTLPLELTVNGVLQSDKLYSGEPLDTGNKDVLLYLAPMDAINPNDAYDGPIFVMQTPDWEVTTYLESEDSIHLDVTQQIRSANVQAHKLHGVVGQTLAWRADDVGENVKPHNHTMVGSSTDYYLGDGLTGTSFTHSKFCWPKCQPETRAEVRKLATGQVAMDFTGAISGLGRH